MPHHKHARSIAELNFYEDRILFPGEKPEDIIGFCMGLTGKPGDPLKDRILTIKCRRIGINPKYTDIRREVGNLLLRFWVHKKTNMTKFWIRDANANAERLDYNRNNRVNHASVSSTPIKAKKVDATLASLLGKDQTDSDGIFYYRLLEAFEPAKLAKLFRSDKSFSAKKTTSKPVFIVNGVKTHNAPLLDIVRPTLLVYTMDASFLQFTKNCIQPKAPSIRLNPYNRNMRLWLNKTVLSWYADFDADKDKNGGEFWYDLVVQLNGGFTNNPFLRTLDGDNTFFGDPGDGMGGGERFP